MTDTVKLIIEIPKEKELIDKAIWYDVSDFDTEDLAIILTALKNGVPLDDIKALEQEPCEDAIDRAEAMTEIMMFAGNVKSDEEDVYIKVSDAVQLLRELPPANPQEPKTGHWREDIDKNRRWDRVRFYCSECGNWQTYGKTHYCPNCGAKMESEDKE